jgi:hypothetical protein
MTKIGSFENKVFSYLLVKVFVVMLFNPFFFIMYHVVTLAFGSWLKQGLAKVWAKSEAWESRFMLLGV